METIVQEVKDRTIVGRRVRALRKMGVTPANIFGPGLESRSIQAETADLEKTLSQAGGTHLITLKNPSDEDRKVLVKGIQRDTITGKLLHVDFHQVSLKDKVRVSVPLVFEGEAPATRRKELVFLENLSSIEVECLPTEIPGNISVDVSGMAEAGDSITVGQLSVDSRVTIISSPDDTVARVSLAKVTEIEEEVEEEVEAEEAETKAEEPSGTTALPQEEENKEE